MEAGRVGEGGKKPFLEWKTKGRCGASRWSAKQFYSSLYQKVLDSRGPLMEAVTKRSGYFDFSSRSN